MKPSSTQNIASPSGTALGSGLDLALLMRELPPYEAAALILLDPRQPDPESLLVAQGLKAQQFVRWCQTEFKHDAWLQQARRRGVMTGKAVKNKPGPPLPGGHHLLICMLPASTVTGRWWYLALGRAGAAFDAVQQQQAALSLRAMQVAFDHVPEPGMRRLVLSEEDLLIHADPRSEICFLRRSQFLKDLTAQLRPVVEQRWPALTDGLVHDLALRLDDQPVWVRFHRSQPLEESPHRHWYLELRPLEEDDIPPLGLLEDDRVARAVAYLSDHYPQSPSLTDVATAVHTSPFHFHRLFVKHTGISPKHYLLRMQLMIAKWLLRTTPMAVGRIASATGFASHGHFTATFHRAVGISPTTYREQR